MENDTPYCVMGNPMTAEQYERWVALVEAAKAEYARVRNTEEAK